MTGDKIQGLEATQVVIDEAHQLKQPHQRGEKGGLCARSTCNVFGAIYQHVDFRDWYCETCANQIHEQDKATKNGPVFFFGKRNQEAPTREQVIKAIAIGCHLNTSLEDALKLDGIKLPGITTDFFEFRSMLQRFQLSHYLELEEPDKSGQEFAEAAYSLSIYEGGRDHATEHYDGKVVYFDLGREASGYMGFHSTWYFDAKGAFLGMGSWE